MNISDRPESLYLSDLAGDKVIRLATLKTAKIRFLSPLRQPFRHAGIINNQRLTGGTGVPCVCATACATLTPCNATGTI
jgi:hypothetical protein